MLEMLIRMARDINEALMILQRCREKNLRYIKYVGYLFVEDRDLIIELLAQKISNPTEAQEKLFELIKVGLLCELSLTALIQTGADVNKDTNGFTALMFAADLGYEQVVDELLALGADATRQNKQGETALMLAAKSGNLFAIVSLLKFEKNADKQDEQGRTALFFAVEQGHIKEVRYLLKTGAYANMQNNDGQTALMVALSRNFDDIAYLLQRYDAR